MKDTYSKRTLEGKVALVMRVFCIFVVENFEMPANDCRHIPHLLFMIRSPCAGIQTRVSVTFHHKNSILVQKIPVLSIAVYESIGVF